MNDTTIAKRYAEILLLYLKETIGLQRGINEIERIKQSFEENPQFKDLLSNWLITIEEKFDSIEKVFKKAFSQEIKDFLKFLVQKKRIKNVVTIINAAISLDREDKEVEIIVRTSLPLDHKTTETLKEVLAKKFHKKVELKSELVPQLIGGAQIVIGNIHIDGSIRRRILELKEKLASVRIA